VQVLVFNGTVTGATLGGQATAENVHPFTPVERSGAIRLRMGSGGAAPGVFAVAILEAADGSGGWREVARTTPQADSTVDAPAAAYAGDLRVRVRIAEPGLGQVQYVVGVSFTPAR
jgi:hypothetical protein